MKVKEMRNVISHFRAEEFIYIYMTQPIIVQPCTHITHHFFNTDPNTARHIIVQKDAQVTIFEYTLRGTVQASTTITLAEPGAEAHIASVFLGSSDAVFNLNHTIIHDAPHTISNIQTRGLLLDRAKTNYKGLIHINKTAPYAQGYQKIDTLVASEQAYIDQTPVLEIHNDNVKCSHGATIGHFDPEHLFYLMSGGMIEHTAKQTLAKGFLLAAIHNTCPALIIKTIDEALTTV